MKIIFRRLAAAEVREAVAWYNVEQAGLGREFSATLHELLQHLVLNPQGCQLYHKSIRRAVMKRFPYLLYYESTATEIRVFRVVHASRDPVPVRDLLPE